MFVFDNSYVRDVPELSQHWRAATAPSPQLALLNSQLARELGLDEQFLATPDGVNILVGNTLPEGAASVAMAYAGHQFGHYSPRLGDGRALLLGEIITPQGARRDVHLKGSGRTPFSRGGDGKAALGPMLREYVMGEAMRGLGIPTTQALAVLLTGEEIYRTTPLAGAVLVRVAQCHIRVGTFEYVAATGNTELLRRLADYSIQRFYPEVKAAELPYLAFYEAVVEAQARLIAQWMSVGFIHGVMNTDNMSIAGETIDYGPCAFMDGFHPETVFSSIDTNGRYAYGAQPPIAQWNLARLGETLLPLFDTNEPSAIEKASSILQTFPGRFRKHFIEKMALKLGLPENHSQNEAQVDEILQLLASLRMDFTSFFRQLSSSLNGELSPNFAAHASLRDWHVGWKNQRLAETHDLTLLQSRLERHNPLYIPRNHLVEEALESAVHGDMSPFHQLLALVREPFTEKPEDSRYTQPAPDSFGPYQTFCGT